MSAERRLGRPRRNAEAAAELARVAGVGVDEILAGRWRRCVCAHCGAVVIGDLRTVRSGALHPEGPVLVTPVGFDSLAVRTYFTTRGQIPGVMVK